LLFTVQAEAAWKMMGIVGGAGAVGLMVAAGPASCVCVYSKAD
jgi:hypothetical protein